MSEPQYEIVVGGVTLWSHQRASIFLGAYCGHLLNTSGVVKTNGRPIETPKMLYVDANPLATLTSSAGKVLYFIQTDVERFKKEMDEFVRLIVSLEWKVDEIIAFTDDNRHMVRVLKDFTLKDTVLKKNGHGLFEDGGSWDEVAGWLCKEGYVELLLPTTRFKLSLPETVRAAELLVAP